MRGAVLYGPRDVRFEERQVPKSSSRRTPSSESRPRACAGLIWPYPWHSADCSTHPMGARVLRHRGEVGARQID